MKSIIKISLHESNIRNFRPNRTTKFYRGVSGDLHQNGCKYFKTSFFLKFLIKNNVKILSSDIPEMTYRVVTRYEKKFRKNLMKVFKNRA